MSLPTSFSTINLYPKVSFGEAEAQKAENTPAVSPNPPQQPASKSKFDSFIDKFSTGIRNSADLNDTVSVPRTIFKGYFSFMVGTTFMSIASFMKKDGIMNKSLNVIGLLTALFGTYNFVKPYLIKNDKK